MTMESRLNVNNFPINLEGALDNSTPSFIKTILLERFARNYNTFILYGNIHDKFPITIFDNEENSEYTILSPIELLLKYCLGPVIISGNEELKKLGVVAYQPSTLEWQESSHYIELYKKKVEDEIKEYRDSYGLENFSDPPVGNLESIQKYKAVMSSQMPLLGLIADSELLFRSEDGKSFQAGALSNIIVELARDDKVTYLSPSINILMSSEPPSILHPALRNEQFIKPIEVELPDDNTRSILFDETLSSLHTSPKKEDSDSFKFIKSELAQFGDDEKAHIIKNSGGCTLNDLIHFVQLKAANNELQGNLENSLWEYRRNIVQSQGEGMLSLIEPQHGREAVGGLDYVFEILEESVYPLLKDRNPLAPAGMLMLGPPGTGKSITAEAIAQECGVSFVNFRLENVLRWFVGSSESRMDKVLKLITAVAPCIVFIDELDQMGMNRGGFQGDSGVSARIFKRLLEFMGDDSNNGHIFFIGATNEATLLDQAIKRSGRFDIKIPMIPRGTESRAGILKALLNKYNGQLIEAGIEVGDINLKQVAENAQDLVGSDLEYALKKALRATYTTKNRKLTKKLLMDSIQTTVPSVEKEKRNRYIKEALMEANDLSKLPQDLLDIREKLLKQEGPVYKD